MLWIAAALILCSVIAWIALHRQCKTGSEVGAVVAWTLAILVLVASLVSFGLWIFMLPLAALMVVAAATCRGPDEKRV